MDQELKNYLDEFKESFNKRLDGLDHRLDGVDFRLKRVDHRLDRVEHRLDGVEHRLDRVEHRLDGVDQTIAAMAEDIKTVAGFNTVYVSSNPLAESNSPITLSKQGKEFAEEVNLFDIIERSYPYVETQMQHKDVKSKLQAEEAITSIATSYRKFISPEDIAAIENIAFDKGLNRLALTGVLAILFREKYLDKHIVG